MLWWVAAFWLWMLMSGDWNTIELVAAACAATLTATAAEAARAIAGLRWRIPARDVASAWSQAYQVVVDFVIVLGALLVSAVRLRMVRGRFFVRAFRPARGRAPRRFGSRAWRTYVATISPNAYVVDVDEDERTVLVHDLVPFRKSEEPAAQ
jgi:multisubunit Na+/H+ antiporter MnhE subunit